MKPYFLFIIFGMFIDGLQAGISSGIFMIFSAASAAAPAAGGLAGAVVGCLGGAAVGAIAGVWFGGFGAIPGALGGCAVGAGGGAAAGSVIGTLAAATAVPTGIALGFAISVGISITFGSFFITLLGFNNMWYPRYFLPGGVGEILPGIDIIPGWTGISIMSVIRRYKEDQQEAIAAEQAQLTPEDEVSEKEDTPNRVPARAMNDIVSNQSAQPIPSNKNSGFSTKRYAA